MPPLKKIVAIGPESTGKSSLCAQLANHFKSIWCKEFARDFLLANGIRYTYNELLTIAKGQLAMEDTCALFITNQKTVMPSQRLANNLQLRANRSSLTPETPNLLFIDTDMYVMKVWCEYVFGKCHPFILDEITKRKYDLYLLCNIDTPWTPDALREYPDIERRQEQYNIYKKLLTNQQTPWVEITGINEKRFQNAIDAVEIFFNVQ